jgi:hypothetical protein
VALHWFQGHSPHLRVAGKEPVMTATAVPRSPLRGGDLGSVGEMSRLARGLSEMSKMSAKRRSDVRDVRVHRKPPTAREVASQ